MKGKTVLYIILALALLTVIRETGWLNINWYKSKINATTTSSWSNTSSTIPWSNPSGSMDPCEEIQPGQVPVGISIEEEFLLDDPQGNKCLPVMVTISNLGQPGLWVPLYKSSSFSFSVPANYTKVRRRETDIQNLSISGNITITGVISVFGICSQRQAKKLLRDYIRKEINTAVRNYLVSLK